MSLHERAKTRVRVDSELSELFEDNVGMHQRSVLSLLFQWWLSLLLLAHLINRQDVASDE